MSSKLIKQKRTKEKARQIHNYTGRVFFVCFGVFFAVRGPLSVVASPVAEHRLWTRRLRGHSSRA